MIKTRQRKTSTGEYLPGWYTEGVKQTTSWQDLCGKIWARAGSSVIRQPNNIASAAFGMDINLGIRAAYGTLYHYREYHQRW